jgi:hypothetical protein
MANFVEASEILAYLQNVGYSVYINPEQRPKQIQEWITVKPYNQ